MANFTKITWFSHRQRTRHWKVLEAFYAFSTKYGPDIAGLCRCSAIQQKEERKDGIRLTSYDGSKGPLRQCVWRGTALVKICPAAVIIYIYLIGHTDWQAHIIAMARHQHTTEYYFPLMLNWKGVMKTQANPSEEQKQAREKVTIYNIYIGTLKYLRVKHI